MKSATTERFRKLYAAAGAQRQVQIKRAYKLWRDNPAHPSIRFKKVHDTEPIYSVRVDLDWRALGVLLATAGFARVRERVHSNNRSAAVA